MRRARTGFALTLILGAAAVATLTSTAVARDRRDGKHDASLRQLRGVNFVSNCRFSHRAADDPIVFPGRPGASHDHSFVGNRSTSAFSTLESLLAAPTTCRLSADTAAYWMPTLYVDGQPVAPLGATIYYRRRTVGPVTAFPAGFKMISGDSKATTPQSMRVTYWNCGVQVGLAPSSTPPACPAEIGSGLRLHVTFPSCWDGVQTDSSDHRSHVAYALVGRCPVAYPVSVPAITLIYRYPVTGAHAFEVVGVCLNRLRHCGVVR